MKTKFNLQGFYSDLQILCLAGTLTLWVNPLIDKEFNWITIGVSVIGLLFILSVLCLKNVKEQKGKC